MGGHRVFECGESICDVYFWIGSSFDTFCLKKGRRITKEECGSSASLLADTLRGIKFLRCQL